MKLIEKGWQQDLSDKQIAAQLTAAGFHSPRKPKFSWRMVAHIRLSKGWKIADPSSHRRKMHAIPGYLTIAEVVERIGCARSCLYLYIEQGKIDANAVLRHPNFRMYLIRDDPEVIEQIRLKILDHAPSAKA